MQNAKDSFYMALRTRLTAINPERTILLRGAVRPGIVDLASTMAAEQCEVVYQTCGTQSFGGLDRGRSLSALDEELAAMVQPFYTPKLNFATTPPATMLTRVFWDQPKFGPMAIQRDRLSRSASVMVYSYQEQGE